MVINVLANDSAVNGTLDPASVKIEQQPASGSAVVDPAAGKIAFTPQAVGTAVFSDTVRDSFNTVSDPATVSVAVAASASGPGRSETGTIALTKASASTATSKGVTTTKWVVEGTASRPSTAQAVNVSVYIGSSATGTPLGPAPVDATGNWRLVLESPRGPDATRTVSVKSSTGAVQQGFAIK